MANVRIPPGYWAALAAVFAVLLIVFVVRGGWLMALFCLGMAIFTGSEAAGRGPFSSGQRQP